MGGLRAREKVSTLANWMAGRNQISVGAVERIMDRLGLVVISP